MDFDIDDSNGVEIMVEVHVDSLPQNMLPHLPLGGNLSVLRQPNHPIVVFVGRDEAIFKQFLFLSKMWTGPNGERPLLPKDKGAGIMISLFITQEYGLISRTR